MERTALARHLALRGGIALIVLAAAYVLRPLVHPVVYSMLNSPGALIFWGLTILAGVVLWFLPPGAVGGAGDTDGRTLDAELEEIPEQFEFDLELGESANRKVQLFFVVVALAVLLAGVYSVPANMVEERTLATETMAEADEIDSFPHVAPENARIAPRPVSDVQTRGSVSYRQYRLGTSDIARMEDGRLAWSYSIQPDGFRNTLVEHQQGVVMSDMTRMEDRELRAVDDSQFEVGKGMLLHRSSAWNLVKTDFWAQYRDDSVEFVHDGTPYLAYPKTGHEWRLTPIPHTIPTWEGVALIDPDGNIQHLSPAEARESEILDGQRLYPLYNTDRKMKSLRFRGGIINQFPTIGAHEDQVELADLPPGAGNEQPFVIDLEGERMSYVTAMEPFGEDTRGLDEVWFVDAETGQLRFFATGEETLTGPERAMGIVRSEDSRTGWGDDFLVVEPVPVTVDDELWWHSKVVPVDNTDVTRNVFVSSETREAVALRSTAAVRDFLAGEDIEQLDDEVETEPAPDEEGIAYYVVIRDGEGNVIERVPIEEGQEASVSFEQPDDGEDEDGENGDGSGGN